MRNSFSLHTFYIPFAKSLPAAALAACLALPGTAFAQSAGGQGLACLQLVEALSQDGRVALEGVTFDFNRATLRPDSLPAMIAARDAILTLGGAWGIEGHTDNRGSRAYNQTLSEARALAVRDWLVAAGVPAGQLSAQGFSLDRPIADNATDAGRAINRRVELVGAVTPDMLGFGGPAGVDPCPDTLTPGTMAVADGTPPPPPQIPDWSGAAGQEWLPFSLLMATGHGGSSGWEGERISMPSGTQPQTCQALCVANSQCAAFSFEPAGANFIETASCALIGYGTELTLRRDNGYLDGGIYHASGLKPDARLLTPESEAEAKQILADLAEIAQLRQTARITAPERHAPETWMDVAVDGAVPGDRYQSFLEISELDDYNFNWQKSKSALFVHEMADGRSGQIWTPTPGDYVFRYAINHPTAGMHVIGEQPLTIAAGASSVPVPAAAANATARGSSVEPGIDRPGMDIAQTPMTIADPKLCEALCAGDPNCRAWTYVKPGLQGDQAVCWTKSGVPDGFQNDCCTSGVMDQASAPAPSAPVGGATASLSFPMMVAPGESIPVTYQGPLHGGDWIDIVTLGNDDDMSGGWSWAYAEGAPVTLTAPATEGDYSLRYVAEDPARGRIVLAQDTLVVRVPASATVAATDLFRRCDGAAGPFCEMVLADQDLVLTLAAGYGITEPLNYETAGGVRAARPSFEVVRLSDAEVVVLVNARQAETVYCQESLAGDSICLTRAFKDSEGMMAGWLFGTLTSHAMHQEASAMGEEEPTIPAGELQGVWFFALDTPGQPGDQSYFVVVELMQDAGDVAVQGSFTTSPELGPLKGVSGDAVGVIAGDTLNLTMIGPDGVRGLVFTGTEFGNGAYRGTVYLANAPLTPPTGAIIRKVAGPGEDWDGAPWMKGETDGMAAALQMGQQAMQGILGDLTGEDRAMAERLSAMMGTLSGGAGAAAPAQAATSPAMAGLDGQPLDGITAEDVLTLIAPHRDN